MTTRNFSGYGTAATMLVAAAWAELAAAAPAGYVKQTLPLGGPPVALAFAPDGRLFVLEQAGFGNNTARMRVFDTAGAPLTSFDVVGDDETNFFVGGMAFDPHGDRLLVTDNTAGGLIYAVGTAGGQTTLPVAVPAIAGIAVRSTGEIVVATALGFGGGGVYEIDRATSAKTLKLPGLDYGAGLAFDASGDLIVQDSSSTTFQGRLQRVPTAPGGEGLQFGAATTVLEGMTSAYGLALDDEGELFATGGGGVYHVGGDPASETLFDSNGASNQFSTAIAFSAGAAPFAPFRGPGGGALAFAANAAFGDEDLFVTLLAPAAPEDFDSNGLTTGGDLAVWATHAGSAAALREHGDADGDQDIDGADFLLWQRSVGRTTLLPGGATALVPEPSSGALAVLAALFAGRLARTRSST